MTSLALRSEAASARAVAAAPDPCGGLLRAAADLERAILAADDAARLQGLAAPFAPDGPVLVATLSGLERARAAAGPAASAADLLAALADLQGIPAADRAPLWAEPRRAIALLADIAMHLPSGTSFAAPSERMVFVNLLRMPSLASGLAPLADPGTRVRLPLDLCLMHELGHVVEARLGLGIPHGRFAAVPREAPDREVPGGRPDRLRSAMRWHAEECFADAFAAAALAASGAAPDLLARAFAIEAARLLGRELGEVLAASEFWRMHRLWPGIYLTLGATGLALRRAPGAGADAAEVARAAERAARRGALPADVLREVARGNPPGWLPELDPTGAFAAARLLFRRRESAAPLWRDAWLADVRDPLSRLVRIAALGAACGTGRRLDPGRGRAETVRAARRWASRTLGDWAAERVDD